MLRLTVNTTWRRSMFLGKGAAKKLGESTLRKDEPSGEFAKKESGRSVSEKSMEPAKNESGRSTEIENKNLGESTEKQSEESDNKISGEVMAGRDGFSGECTENTSVESTEKASEEKTTDDGNMLAVVDREEFTREETSHLQAHEKTSETISGGHIDELNQPKEGKEHPDQIADQGKENSDQGPEGSSEKDPQKDGTDEATETEDVVVVDETNLAEILDEAVKESLEDDSKETFEK